MKYSKIVLSGILAISIFGMACNPEQVPNVVDDPNPTTSPQTNNTNTGDNNSSSASPSPSDSGLNTVSSPKPEGDLGEVSPDEPPEPEESIPFIIGKSPSPFNGNSSSSGSDDGSEDTTNQNVVPSKVSGYVMGYNVNSQTYSPIPYADVSIGGTVVKANSTGKYETDSEITSLVNISAKANNYALSTVANLMPGTNRDIHLQPINLTPQFSENTIAFTSDFLGAEAPDKKKYPLIVSFNDKNNSRFQATLTDAAKGTYNLEVNPLANQNLVEGKLLTYDLERDLLGNTTNPTQMKTYKIEDMKFQFGDSKLATGTSPVEGTSATPADFINISAKFHNSGFTSFVCNAYIVYPSGEKILASTYKGSVPGNLSFKLPSISEASYTIEAHAGTATKGSDVVINDLHDKDSVEVYLLPVPSGISPYYTDTVNSPNFSWGEVDQAKAYQVEVNHANGSNKFRWEGFTTSSGLGFPLGIGGLERHSQYRLQVIAMDFYTSGLKILSNNKAEQMRARAFKNSGDLKYKVMLQNYNTNTLPKGYRVSYDTVLFRVD